VTKIPGLSFEDLIRCYTLNPSRALRIDHRTGSFVPGKIPGINLITNIDFNELKLTEKSELKVII
jgi:predicted amidohydrolase YtcJ